MNGMRRPCPGCGALAPDIDGPAHRYIGASPGCWAIFGEVLAREYGDYRYWPVHQLTVDAYAVQHPGEPSPRAIRSVGVHLIGLHLLLEEGYTPEASARTMQRVAIFKQRFVWLEPPPSRGDITVLYVREAKSPVEHARRVHLWAASVWRAWSGHHGTVRRWSRQLAERR
jgi:hypothetical protein